MGNPVIWQAPDGLVWLFYNNQHGDTWSNARVMAKISEDGAKTWSDAFILAMEEGSMVQGKPIVLNDGNYLLPMYHETGEDRERSAEDTCSYFLRYNPETHQWKETNRIRSKEGISSATCSTAIRHQTLLFYAARRRLSANNGRLDAAFQL